MTMTFDSMGDLAVHLTRRYEVTKRVLERGLERVATRIERTAYGKFGHYQSGSGPFPAWAPLADATKEQRVELGYTPDDPLFREGQLQAGLSHEVHDLEAVIGVYGEEGSNPPDVGQIMIWQEMGTANMPPRPVLGPAAFENKDAIERILGEAAVEAVIGDQASRLAGF